MGPKCESHRAVHGIGGGDGDLPRRGRRRMEMVTLRRERITVGEKAGGKIGKVGGDIRGVSRNKGRTNTRRKIGCAEKACGERRREGRGVGESRAWEIGGGGAVRTVGWVSGDGGGNGNRCSGGRDGEGQREVWVGEEREREMGVENRR